jgi:hypothetical protein
MSMDQQQRRGIEQDCGRAVTAFFAHLDAQAFDKQWDEMATGGSWERGGQSLNTREKFLAAMAERPAILTIRHMLSNVLTVVDADGQGALTTFNLLVYRYLADRGDKPAPMPQPSAIAAWRARLKPENGVWRIALLDGETLFQS